MVHRLASVGILGKEREPGVGKLGWHYYDTGFERKYFVQNPVCGFFEIATSLHASQCYKFVSALCLTVAHEWNFHKQDFY